jgi:hypothetical protein
VDEDGKSLKLGVDPGSELEPLELEESTFKLLVITAELLGLKEEEVDISELLELGLAGAVEDWGAELEEGVTSDDTTEKLKRTPKESNNCCFEAQQNCHFSKKISYSSRTARFKLETFPCNAVLLHPNNPIWRIYPTQVSVGPCNWKISFTWLVRRSGLQ